MRKHIASVRQEDDENEINLTPMLDVVFIMLIFFIVTASFIRETGLDAQRPDQDEQPQITDEEGAILVIINDRDEIYIDNEIVDMRSVRPRIEAARAEDAERPMVIQTHPDSTNKMLVAILDEANQAGITNVSIVEY
ncbi:MAG TPA: biopolymer transporter ExbD [Gammaproteobacteria bacterium]|nr:biopolymer transporter ExbD [Gammaproteobacteria bacterium]